MRWLLPLVFVLALAVCTLDAEPRPRRKPARRALELPPAIARPRRLLGAPAGDARSAAVAQAAAFDAATGTLTWLDDDRRYN